MSHPRKVDPVVAHNRAKKGGTARTTVDYHIRKLVDAWPQLTAEQRDELAAILRTGRTPDLREAG